MVRKRSNAIIRTGDDPILTTVCEPVRDESIDHITRDMCHILRCSKTGVGLAANQAGYAKRIVIMLYCGGMMIFVNPVITNHSLATVITTEGCLSYPGRYIDVKRYQTISVSCTNRQNNDTFNGLQARVIQHEIDHLNGECKIKP